MTRIISAMLFMASVSFASTIECDQTKSVTFDFSTNQMTPTDEQVETGNRYYSHTYTGRDNRLVEYPVCKSSDNKQAELVNTLIMNTVKKYDGKEECESKNIKVTATPELPLVSIRVSVYPLDAFFSYSDTYFLTNDGRAIEIEFDISKERFKSELEDIVEQEAFRLKPQLKTAKKQEYHRYANIAINDNKLFLVYNGYQLDYQGGGAFWIEIPFKEWMLKNRDELSEEDMKYLKEYFLVKEVEEREKEP